MNEDLIFNWNPDEDDQDLNKILSNTHDPLQMHSSSSASSINQSPLITANNSPCITTCSDVFGFWSDVVQQPFQPLPPLPPQSSQLREEQDQLQQLLFQQQKEKLKEKASGESSIPLQAQEQGESSGHRVDAPSLKNLECQCQVPSQGDQVVTQGISIGRNNPGSDEHNKRLKSAQTAHTISEKKRREKFKGQIKALEELLPTSDKKDTASILDETIKQIRFLQFQAQWMQKHYMSSHLSTISPSRIPTLPSQLIPTQMMGRMRPNVLGMVPYHTMLHYPAAIIPRMQMLPMLPPPPPLLPFTIRPPSHVAAPRATLTRGGPSTRVITDVPGEDDGGGGRSAPSSSRGGKQDTR